MGYELTRSHATYKIWQTEFQDVTFDLPANTNMNTRRFSFALERLQPGDWARFESFASQFLVFDYPKLRTVAAPSGDLGRDSELFSPEGDPSVFLQYSVRADWRSKIRETAKRLNENFKDAAVLIYVSNQQIGAEADAIKKELRKTHKLTLDVHDRNWFVERLATDDNRGKVAEQLAMDVVDPYLAGKGVVESIAPSLTAFESKAAVLHLQLQWEDDSRERGLTKMSYEALVKSVLRETSSERRIKKQAVRDAVRLREHHSNRSEMKRGRDQDRGITPPTAETLRQPPPPAPPEPPPRGPPPVA
jgi:hypothetical protein